MVRVMLGIATALCAGPVHWYAPSAFPLEYIILTIAVAMIVWGLEKGRAFQ